MDTILVGIIVAGALLFIVRGLVRVFQGKKSCGCGCSCTGGSCPPDRPAGKD